MNESSRGKEQEYSNQFSMSKSVARCRDDIMCCDETGAEGNATNCGDDLAQSGVFHQSNGLGISESIWTNSSGLTVPTNQECCASSSSCLVPHSSRDLRTCFHNIPGNHEFSESDQNQVLDPLVRENGLIEMNRRKVPTKNDCSSTPGDIFFPLAHGFHKSSNNVQTMCLQLPATTGLSSTIVTHSEQNVIGEQIDGGYMEEADAYMESGDIVAANLMSERGAGVHLPFGMDVGAAGGGGIDDIGDFIDADIPQRRNDSSQISSRSNDSVTSSFEELTASMLANEKAEVEKVDPRFSLDGTPVDAGFGIADEVRKRLLGCAVNNLNQTGRTQGGGPRHNLTGNFGAMLRQSQASGLSQSGSLSHDKEVSNNQGRRWRWSDGDGMSGALPSLTSAASLASDLSYGTASALLMSPLSMEDDVIASVMSSPECPNQLPLKVNECSRGAECHVNLENPNSNGNEREDLWCTEPVSESYCNCKSCNELLENMNQTTSKYVLEKSFAWETTANTDKSSAMMRRRHLQNSATVIGHGSRHPLSLSHSGDSCPQCSSDHHCMSASFSGNEILSSDFTGSPNRESFDTYGAGKSLRSTPSDESFYTQKNRRFSYQNPIDVGSSDFQSSSRVDGCRWTARNGTMASALSENSLHSTQLLRSHPLSLLLDSQRARGCLDGGSQRIRNGNASRYEAEPMHKMKILACAQPMSLSEEEKEEEVTEEAVNNGRAHRRNKNGHHCRFGNEMKDFVCDVTTFDVNFSRPVNSALKSGLINACCTSPVTSLLHLLGVNAISQHVCDLFPSNGLMGKASLPDYLLLCSTAGISAEQLISRVAQLTKDLIYGKFFHLYPQRNVDLIQWLKYWIRKGAVPLATLKHEYLDGSGDSWQHRLLHNAWEPGLADVCLSEDALSAQCFSADSSLRISRHNIVSRWHDNCDLNMLLTQTDTRWHEMNVLGQVVNILREEKLQTAVGGYRPQLTSHIIIPTHFKSGVTLYVRTDSAGYAELKSADSDFPAAVQSNGRADESVKQILTPQDRNKSRANGSKTRIRETLIF